MADKNIFYKNVKFLNNYFTVYTYDFKGFGGNKNMEYPYSLFDYANDLKEFIKKNGIVRPNVVAHSFGARVVILLASSEPNLFNKIVLTGAAGCKPRFSAVKFFKRLLFKILRPFVKREKLLRFYSKDYLSLSPVMRESFKKIVGFNLDGYLSKIRNETLIICGKKDRETPPYTARRMHRKIKGSSLVCFKDSGHFAFIDESYKFNMAVKEFIKK